MVPTDEALRFEVPADLDGGRLDVVVARHVTDRSRTRLQEIIRAGGVRVNGDPVRRPNAPVQAGAAIAVELPAREGPVTASGRRVTELQVLFEDEHLIVIDKPAGVVVHPNDKFRSDTVADLARQQFGELPSVQGENRPGIVHRLDRLTSGVMLLGRTSSALQALKDQFKSRSVQKTYFALAHGSPRFDSEWIETPIGSSEKGRDRRRVVAEGEGREASTYYEVRERFHGFCHLVCRPKTGRTHQIRVHLHSVGLPIVGDRLYRHGGPVAVPLPESAPVLARQALHAQRIEFDHPVTGERLVFEAPLPDDLGALLEWLRIHMPERDETA